MTQRRMARMQPRGGNDQQKQAPQQKQTPEQLRQQRRQEALKKRLGLIERSMETRAKLKNSINEKYRGKVDKVATKNGVQLLAVAKFNQGFNAMMDQWAAQIFTPDQLSTLHQNGTYSAFLKKFRNQTETFNKEVHGKEMYEHGKIFIFTPTTELLNEFNLTMPSVEMAENQHYHHEAQHTLMDLGYSYGVDIITHGKTGDKMQMSFTFGGNLNVSLSVPTKNFNEALKKQLAVIKTIQPYVQPYLNQLGLQGGRIDLNLSKEQHRSSTCVVGNMTYELNLNKSKLKDSLAAQLKVAARLHKSRERVQKEIANAKKYAKQALGYAPEVKFKFSIQKNGKAKYQYDLKFKNDPTIYTDFSDFKGGRNLRSVMRTHINLHAEAHKEGVKMLENMQSQLRGFPEIKVKMQLARTMNGPRYFITIQSPYVNTRLEGLTKPKVQEYVRTHVPYLKAAAQLQKMLTTKLKKFNNQNPGFGLKPEIQIYDDGGRPRIRFRVVSKNVPTPKWDDQNTADILVDRIEGIFYNIADQAINNERFARLDRKHGEYKAHVTAFLKAQGITNVRCDVYMTNGNTSLTFRLFKKSGARVPNGNFVVKIQNLNKGKIERRIGTALASAGIRPTAIAKKTPAKPKGTPVAKKKATAKPKGKPAAKKGTAHKPSKRRIARPYPGTT